MYLKYQTRSQIKSILQMIIECNVMNFKIEILKLTQVPKKTIEYGDVGYVIPGLKMLGQTDLEDVFISLLQLKKVND